MTKSIEAVLGSEYTVAIENEINKVKQSERLLMGKLVAVVKRSDTSLGRPEEDCNQAEIANYAIFAPSIYSVICNKDFGTIRNDGSEWKLISLNSLLEQALDYHFTYLHILLSSEIIYESQEFKAVRTYVSNLLENNEKSKELCFSKMVSLLIGVTTNINKDKFKSNEASRDAVFLAYKVINICENFINNHTIKIDSSINMHEYKDLTNNCVIDNIVNNTVKQLIYSRVSKIIDYETKNFTKTNKDETKVIKLMHKLNIMKPIISDVLN